jgi:hypothetical protein
VLLHLAGVYDETSAACRRWRSRSPASTSATSEPPVCGDPTLAGQSMLHKDDMVDAFRRTVDRRADLPPLATS